MSIPCRHAPRENHTGRASVLTHLLIDNKKKKENKKEEYLNEKSINVFLNLIVTITQFMRKMGLSLLY
jgi:hypothetical protein